MPPTTAPARVRCLAVGAVGTVGSVVAPPADASSASSAADAAPETDAAARAYAFCLGGDGLGVDGDGGTPARCAAACRCRRPTSSAPPW